MKWREKPETVRPMLATLADAPLAGEGLLYEPKYDGIRALVHVAPGRAAGGVRIWSRLGNDKTSQFPAIVRALDAFRAKLEAPLFLDGEIVALDANGQPAGFQQLQGRIHLIASSDVESSEKAQPVALIAFDLLREGDDDLRGLPLTDRRARLEARFPASQAALRISEQVQDDGRQMQARVLKDGWEGLIVKEARAPYQSGRRSPTWRKLKIVHEQEFVVGGWTEPRQTRQYFGALLLGVHDGAGLQYAGHTGTGFDQRELARVWALLEARAAAQSPFAARIRTNEPAHWVRPDLVAQVKFTEWTADGKLRHPVYLGLRDDKRAADVVRENPARVPNRVPARKATARKRPADALPVAPAVVSRKRAPGRAASRTPVEAASASGSVVAQLAAIEESRKDGVLSLPDGSTLPVTNLSKVYWPEPKLTKGALLRYYAEVAPLILPAVADRPLVMKRFPTGVAGPAFYQQRSRQEKTPAGVRIEALPDEIDPISEPDARRFIGGSLITLLYMAQIAAISQDPWFSRVQSPLDADYVALDLDPDADTPFARVLDVARWIRDELATLKVPAVPKTSGSSGLHIYIPLAPGTSYESGQLFCQIVATMIAARHPKTATVERSVRARPRGTVYVDYLQNILGKTLATAYSARASAFAGVSTPLRWQELDEKIEPRDFTIVTAPARFGAVGDLWGRLRTTKPANLEVVFRKYQTRLLPSR